VNSPPIVLLFRRCAFDPIKLRQLSELLAKEVEVRHALLPLGLLRKSVLLVTCDRRGWDRHGEGVRPTMPAHTRRNAQMPCHPEGGGLRPKLRRGRPGRRGARSGGRHMPGTYAMYVSGERPCGRRASAEAFSHLWRRD